jgi:hypothetical protein
MKEKERNNAFKKLQVSTSTKRFLNPLTRTFREQTKISHRVTFKVAKFNPRPKEILRKILAKSNPSLLMTAPRQ